MQNPQTLEPHPNSRSDAMSTTLSQVNVTTSTAQMIGQRQWCRSALKRFLIGWIAMTACLFFLSESNAQNRPFRSQAMKRANTKKSNTRIKGSALSKRISTATNAITSFRKSIGGVYTKYKARRKKDRDLKYEMQRYARWQMVRYLPRDERHLMTLEHVRTSKHLRKEYNAAMMKYKASSASERRAMYAKIGL